MSWQYSVHRVMSGEVLHTQVPLRDVEISRALSGASSLRASLDPVQVAELTRERAGDGLPVLTPWASWLIATDPSGAIRFGGPLMYPVSRRSTRLEFGGTRAWLGRQFWLKRYTTQGEDAVKIMRMLIVSAFDESGLGFPLLEGSTASRVEVGSPPKDVEFTTGSGENVSFSTNDGPYILSREDGVNIGDELDDLTGVGESIDYEDIASWGGTFEGRARFGVRIGYPRLGTRRDDLEIDTAVNATAMVVVAGGESFANYGIGVGRGEGIRSAFYASDQRARLFPSVMHAMEDKSADQRLLRSKTIRMVRRMNQPLMISEVTIRDTALGSWNLGDDLYVQTDEVSQWCRVVGETWAPAAADRAVLTLEPSDVFEYGRPV